ncbi:DUF4168 domain-containing protein [Microbulbifer sp. 2201CG32-9]|uniref:DUF4168 domain-containing protein n=1 Tax=unclassified Microbulbifer TaxID=2619833 RepID=UPI00345BD27A
MKTLLHCLALVALLLALPTAAVQAQTTEAKAPAYSEPKLQQFASAYQAIVVLSREYAPKLQAAADIQEAEAINREAQGKMVAAINQAGLSKEEYQQIAASLRNNPALLERVNKILQQAAQPAE